MRRMVSVLFLVLFFVLSSNFALQAEEKLIFSFEGDLEGWEIPDWAYEQDDAVGEELAVSDKYANEGKNSLELKTNFPGKVWTCAIVEVQEYFDWTPYGSLSVDVYLPATAPQGLKGGIVLTVGEDWTWTETKKTSVLWPGKWTTFTVDLKPGSESFRRTTVDDKFRADVRKLDIRIVSNKKPVYAGPIYIDNVRLGE